MSGARQTAVLGAGPVTGVSEAAVACRVAAAPCTADGRLVGSLPAPAMLQKVSPEPMENSSGYVSNTNSMKPPPVKYATVGRSRPSSSSA